MSKDKLRRYGQWAVVTGASDGIGKAFARDLAKAGMNVVLVSRRRYLLEKVAETLLIKYGVESRIIAMDLSDDAAHKKLREETKDLDVGVFVAAAGFGSSGEFINSAIENELNMIDLNCRAVAAQTYEFANVFVKQGRGAIVLLSSILSFQGVPLSANYAATKAYVQTFAEGLHLELKSKGVDVLSVAPAQVQTGFGKRAGMNINGAPTPDVVSRGALKALGGKSTVRPGFLAKFLEMSLKLPRYFRSRIMGIVMSGMTDPA
jgi:short-subunit dehydrogenase